MAGGASAAGRGGRRGFDGWPRAAAAGGRGRLWWKTGGGTALAGRCDGEQRRGLSGGADPVRQGRPARGSGGQAASPERSSQRGGELGATGARQRYTGKKGGAVGRLRRRPAIRPDDGGRWSAVVAQRRARCLGE